MNFSARARTFALSKPSHARSFSMAEIVDCGMPVGAARSFRLSSCSSRRIRTDSPVVTSMRRLAGLKLFTFASSDNRAESGQQPAQKIFSWYT